MASKVDATKAFTQLDDLEKTLKDTQQKQVDALNATNKQLQDLHSRIRIEKDSLEDLARLQMDFKNKVYEQNTYSTTQFFNGSLAKDMFNMNGNSAPFDYRILGRKAAGIITQGADVYSVNTLGGSQGSQNNNNGNGDAWTDGQAGGGSEIRRQR